MMAARASRYCPAVDASRDEIRRASAADAEAAAQLLHDFNREYDEPTPDVTTLAERIRRLLAHGDTLILLGGDGPDGLALIRLRPSLWNADMEAYLAELYVVPRRRGQGLGRALMDAAMHEARARGAGTMDLGTSESDTAARHLYERLGFTNRERGGHGPVMYVYEREL